MIAEAPPSYKGQPPNFLTPEQVSVLVLYGAARVRQQVQSPPNLLPDVSPADQATTNTVDSKSGAGTSTSDEPQCIWLDDFDVPLPCTREHRAREVVFHDLWRKGYYLTGGEQFGCSYLVYEGLPGEVHAKYLLDYVMEEEDLSMTNIISLVRIATQVKKTLLLAIVAPDSNQPHYLTFDWFKPYSKEIE